eukprot:959409-Amphidinium_carterae.3
MPWLAAFEWTIARSSSLASLLSSCSIYRSWCHGGGLHGHGAWKDSGSVLVLIACGASVACGDDHRGAQYQGPSDAALDAIDTLDDEEDEFSTLGIPSGVAASSIDQKSSTPSTL